MCTFICSRCSEEKPRLHNGGTGYAEDKDGNKTCYECCAEIDREELRNMKPGDKTTHYWNGKEITNWPGTLIIFPHYFTKSRHNFGGWKTHIWFKFEGNDFYAYQIGDSNQSAHIRRIKN